MLLAFQNWKGSSNKWLLKYSFSLFAWNKGGCEALDVSVPDILKFDSKTRQWLKIGEMNKARCGYSVTVLPLAEIKPYCVSWNIIV